MSDMADTPTITEFLLARISEDEAIARACSGNTVEGVAGSWTPVPGGDEWAAHEGDLEVEVLVALRSGLPLPPRGMEGKWGQLAYWESYDADSGTLTSIMPVAQHMARHDPARVLRECAAKRAIVKECDWATRPPLGESFEVPELAESILAPLAAIYADHPDYQDAWAL